ncbi:YqzL family protein [Tuberibacillus sp. Marseille-P3662]|nr:YqzL family protein [Tuberibacillus sp. Marseille-P3662]
MLDFTWKVFCMTGDVDTYLLYKEMENNDGTEQENGDEALVNDTPTQ